MFELYFCPRVVLRFNSSRHAAVLGRFLAYLQRRGHARTTIQNYVRAVDVFLVWLRKRRKPVSTVDKATVRSFACRHSSVSRPCANVHAALRHLLRFLKQEQVSPSAVAEQSALQRAVREYDTYLHGTCGLAAATRLYRRRYAGEFMLFVFGSKRIDWRRLRPHHAQSFLARYADGRVSAAAVASVSIRSFFRWLQSRGRIGARLAEAVPGVRRWRLAGLPTVMTDEQRQAFMAAFDQSCSTGRRDYALALCMVGLGLRVGEVADVTLDDLDDTAGTLRLVSGKSRRDRVLPMPKHLRQTVINYIRRDRPATDDRHLFVRHRVPVGTAVTRELVRGVMRRTYARVAGCEEWTGTHVLRHTAATRLQRSGADLKRIADILGHRSIDTTMIYTKVDLNRLVETALPWPGSQEAQS